MILVDSIHTVSHCFLEEIGETLCPVEKTALSGCGKVINCMLLHNSSVVIDVLYHIVTSSH